MRRLPAALVLALTTASWGAIPLLVRGEAPASHLVAMRMTLGGLTLLVASAAMRRLRNPGRHTGRIVLVGVLLVAHWVTFFVALKLVPVAVTLAIIYLGPVLAAVMAGPVLGERVSRRAATGLVVALTGTMLVVRPGSLPGDVGGMAIATVSAVLLGVLMVVGKPAASAVGGLTFATWEQLTGAVVLAPVASRALAAPAEVWVSYVLLGIVFTGAASVIYWMSMARLPVAIVGVLMYLEPAAAVVLAAIFLGELPDPTGWVGVALVIGGGVLAAAEAPEEEVVGAPAAL